MHHFTTLKRSLGTALCCILLLLGGALATFAQDVINADTLIDEGDASHDSNDVIVDGCTVTINGNHTFNSVVLRNGAIVTHSPAYPLGMRLKVTGDMLINAGCRVDATAKGYPAGAGPGAGINGGSRLGSGGSFGGVGTWGEVPPQFTAYGDLRHPTDPSKGLNLGSGGGNSWNDTQIGGAGGGCIDLDIGGTLSVFGTLSALGEATVYSGAGSGGAIEIHSTNVVGSGHISVIGGDCNYSIVGGGGRIAIYYNTLDPSLSVDAMSGWRGYQTGSPGTIFLKSSQQKYGDLIYKNAGAYWDYPTHLEGVQIFDNLIITSNTRLVPLASPLDITVTGNLLIDSTSNMDATLSGYAPGQGPGAGQSDKSGNGYSGGGGGYGGNGGFGNQPAGSVTLGGTPYGDYKHPTDWGSGGGSSSSGLYRGGVGGGAIRLQVSGVFQLEGLVKCNGQDIWNAGAGSGGSIYLSVGALKGSGRIQANGGWARNYNIGAGGAGSGGRVALYYQSLEPSIFLEAKGGHSDYSGWAEDGTVYLEQVTTPISVALAIKPNSLSSGQVAIGSVSLSAPAPVGGATITLQPENSLLLSVPSTVFVPEGKKIVTFNVTANSVSSIVSTKIKALFRDQTAMQAVTLKPWLAALSLTPSSVSGKGTFTGLVTLNTVAPAGGLTVVLSSSDASAKVPATLTIPAKANRAKFTITTTNVASARSVTLSVNYMAEQQSAVLLINPANVKVQSVSVAPASVLGGRTATGVVVLASAAPSGGVLVALSSADPATASVPSFVKVLAGKTKASFSVTTNPVDTAKTVSISATLGTTVLTSLTVRPIGIITFTLIPNQVQGGDNTVGMVVLDAPATTPVTVLITSSRSEAIPDTTVVIPVGETTATFNIDTLAVSATTLATITASANGTSKSQILKITP